MLVAAHGRVWLRGVTDLGAGGNARTLIPAPAAGGKVIRVVVASLAVG